QWLNCDDAFLPISGATARSFTPSVNGSYTVEVTQNRCIDTSSCFVISGISNIRNDFGNSLRVYPNPSKQSIYIETDNLYREISVRIMSITGQIICNYEYNLNKKFEIELPESKGLYIIELETNEGKSAIVKIFKE
ncbi:MAG: T9SS type A sorting domain-containing protein, partial [Bacteroidota bacterium]